MNIEIWMTPQNILSIVLILVTFAYTITSVLTWLESRAIRKLKNTPNVIVYLKSSVSHDTLYVCVKNIGEGCAKDVRIIPTVDYALFGGKKNFREFSLFSDGVSLFPPQYEMNYAIGFWKNINMDENPMVAFDAYYLDMSGHQITQSFTLPFKQMHTIYSTPPATAEERIPYYLHEIKKEIRNLSLKVDTSQLYDRRATE